MEFGAYSQTVSNVKPQRRKGYEWKGRNSGTLVLGYVGELPFNHGVFTCFSWNNKSFNNNSGTMFDQRSCSLLKVLKHRLLLLVHNLSLDSMINLTPDFSGLQIHSLPVYPKNFNIIHGACSASIVKQSIIRVWLSSPLYL